MQVAVLAVWPLLQQLMNFLVSFVDTAVAGRLSVQATNAIAIAAYFGWFLGLVFMSVGTGASAVVARSIGAGQREDAERALGQALILAVLAGVVVGAFLAAVSWPFAAAAQLKGDGLTYAVEYLRILALAAPAGAILFVGGACLSGEGDTRTPFLVMVTINLINLALSVILAMPTGSVALPGVLGGATLPTLGWGTAGIAWGTAASWLLGGALIVGAMLQGRGGLRLHRWALKWAGDMIRRIVRLGVPNMIERGGQWVGNLAVVMLVGELARREFAAVGSSAVQGAHIIAIRIEAISFLPAMGIMVAASTLTGQYLGAGQPATAKRAASLCWILGAGVGLLTGAMFVLIPEQLVRLLTNEPELLALSPPLVRMCGWIQVFFASGLVLGGAIRGAGDTRGPMVITNVLTWGVRLPAVALIVFFTDWGLWGVWLALCGELGLRGLSFIAWFLRGRWVHAKV